MEVAVLPNPISQFMMDVRQIHQLSQSIEDHIEHSLGNKALSSMFDLQKGLVYYQSAVQSNQVLLSKLRMHADRREEVEAIGAGDIGAILGLKDTTTGETLCDGTRPVLLERITKNRNATRNASLGRNGSSISVGIDPQSRRPAERWGL